ncbi:unnamed protein product [Orchesella dallaii]|uniref:DUF243 domain-containing protein n=1 Tax=Orchesella dallaii TaxID=48710 RepID=A0ABP1RAH2_9HEXA
MRHSVFLAIVCVISSVNSGVISDLPEDQVDQVLALYHQSCGGFGGGYGNSLNGYGGSSNGGYGAPSPNEKVSIVCKEPREYPSVEDKKVIRIPPQYNTAKKQVIFVEVPATHFKHEITLVQEPGVDKKTKIYVLPQKADHTIQVNDQRGYSPGSKPQVFFLKGNAGAQGTGYGPPGNQPGGSYGAPVSQQPPSNYGPPSNQPGDSYGAPVSQQPPSNYGPPSNTPPISYGPPSNPPPPQQPPSNYGAPQNPPPSNYGPPSNPPPSNYGPPQNPPPSNYGPPSNPPPPQQPPPSNYGPPSQQEPISYGPPSNPPPPQEPPPSNYGAPQNPPQPNYGQPPPTNYRIPAGYEVKQTYEVSSNGLTSPSTSYSSSSSDYSSDYSSGSSLSSITSLLSSPSNNGAQPLNTIPSPFKSSFASSLSSSYSSPLASSSDSTISSLLKKLSERLKSYPRRHANYFQESSTTLRPFSRFMFPSESQVFPVYKPIQLGSRIVSRPLPREPKFSSKFTYPGKSVIKANELHLNRSVENTREPSGHVSFVPLEDTTEPVSTTPAYDEDATLSSHAVLDSAVKNTDDEEESPIFDVLPATYVGYSYVLDKSTTPNTNEA